MNVTTYTGANFTGKSTDYPPSWFGEFTPPQTIGSIRIPDGIYVSVSTDVINLDTLSKVRTYTSDVDDLSSYGTLIVSLITQNATVPPTVAQTATETAPAVFYRKPYLTGMTLLTVDPGHTASVYNYDYASMSTGSNVVIVKDQTNTNFTFYKNVWFLFAYMKAVRDVTTVPIPVMTPSSVDSTSSDKKTDNTSLLDKYVTDVYGSMFAYINNRYVLIGIAVVFLVLLLLLIIHRRGRTRA